MKQQGESHNSSQGSIVRTLSTTLSSPSPTEHWLPPVRRDEPAVSGCCFQKPSYQISRLIITLNMTKVVQHIWDAIHFENTEHLEPLYDRDRPLDPQGIWELGTPANPASVPNVATSISVSMTVHGNELNPMNSTGTNWL